MEVSEQGGRIARTGTVVEFGDSLEGLVQLHAGN